MEKEKHLSNRTILGYGVASIGDGAAFNYMLMYMIFFLIEVADVDTVRAGSIYSIAVICQVFITAFIGPITDNAQNRFGRRRPYILAGGIIMSIAGILLFTVVDFGTTGSYIYYIAICTIYNAAYMLWLTPYTALGTELTDDYDERTKLRTPPIIFQNIGFILGMSLPMAAVAFFVSKGASDEGAWRIFTILLLAISLISILITWRATRGCEQPAEKIFKSDSERNGLKTYLRIMRLKPMIWLIAGTMIFFIGYTVYDSGLAYYVLYCTGMSEAGMTTAILVNIFVSMGMAVVISKFAQLTDKRMALLIAFLFSAVGMTIVNIIGVHSMLGLIIIMFFFNVGSGAFFLLAYLMQYDAAEVYDYKYGGRKEGTIYTYMAVMISLAEALGAQVMTRFLDATGYDPSLDQQAAGVAKGISEVVIEIPSFCFFLVAICVFLYPVTKKRYEILMEQKANKEAGKAVDESQIKRLL